MERYELANRITELLFGTSAPSGQIWTAIHEIENTYKAELAALRAQLVAAEEREKKLEKELFVVNSTLQAAGAISSAQLAAARAENERLWNQREELTEASAAWLTEKLGDEQYARLVSSFRARPDDGRVERVARVLFDTDYENRHNDPFPHDTRDWHHMAGTERFYVLARAVIAAADGAERGGR